MTEKDKIFREFENEMGFKSNTTSDCDLTNWIVKKLIEARYKPNQKTDTIEPSKYIGVKTDLFGYNGDIGTIDRFYPSYGETGQFRITYEHDKYISWVNIERVKNELSNL